jgi:hypothetical protein
MTKKSKFAQRGESMLTGRVASLEEFLDDKPSSIAEPLRKSDITDNRNNNNSDKPITAKSEKQSNQNLERRFELKIPDHLAKRINDHAFEQRISKAAVVIEALQKYFHA